MMISMEKMKRKFKIEVSELFDEMGPGLGIIVAEQDIECAESILDILLTLERVAPEINRNITWRSSDRIDKLYGGDCDDLVARAEERIKDIEKAMVEAEDL